MLFLSFFIFCRKFNAKNCDKKNIKYSHAPPLKHTTKKNQRNLNFFRFRCFAEREGFEPPVPLGTAVFKTAVIDHSTISPRDLRELVSFNECKGTAFFETGKEFCRFFEKKLDNF